MILTHRIHNTGVGAFLFLLQFCQLLWRNQTVPPVPDIQGSHLKIDQRGIPVFLLRSGSDQNPFTIFAERRGGMFIENPSFGKTRSLSVGNDHGRVGTVFEVTQVKHFLLGF